MDFRRSLLYVTLLISVILTALFGKDAYAAYQNGDPFLYYAGICLLMAGHTAFTIWRILRFGNQK